MYASISFTIDVPVYPERVYRAWLDSYEHGRFTSLPAQITGKIGGQFITLDGQVESVIQMATPFNRIIQTWQMAEFPQNAADSTIELVFEPTCTGSEIKMTQNGVEAAITRQVMQWWEDRYFRPLRAYFDELVGDYVADMGDG